MFAARDADLVGVSRSVGVCALSAAFVCSRQVRSGIKIRAQEKRRKAHALQTLRALGCGSAALSLGVKNTFSSVSLLHRVSISDAPCPEMRHG